MHKIQMTFIFAFCCTLIFGNVGQTAEPQLLIETKTTKVSFTRDELLKRKDLETLTIKNDPSYPGKEMTYRAIKVNHLFDKINISDDAVILFKALDGFSAPLEKKRLLNDSSNQAIAYVAIELPGMSWPHLKSGHSSAGPFYLVWMNSELSSIGSEEWPYMLAGFKVENSLETIFPKIFPAEGLDKNDPIYKGFRSFVKNCFACHTLNKNGTSNIGPDLNLPTNPTDYLTPSALRTLIRNPQNLRSWPKGRMSGFDQSQIPDQELEDIISYLKHMSPRKQ